MKTFPRTFNPEPRRATGRSNSIAPPPLSPSDFARRQLTFFPDPLQSAVLDSTAKRGILLCSRQWGKSTVLAAKSVHRAFTTPGALILAASPGDRQSRLFLQKAAAFLAQLNIPRRGDGDNPASLLLPNRSRIIALPGSEATIRGFSASMILIDEAARVDDALYSAIQPMLATTDGDLWLMSTPWGKRGFFYNVWAHGGEDWQRHLAKATDCPRISPDWLERQRNEMPSPSFRQEYLCEFVDTEDTWFPRDLIEAALSDTEQPL